MTNPANPYWNEWCLWFEGKAEEAITTYMCNNHCQVGDYEVRRREAKHIFETWHTHRVTMIVNGRKTRGWESPTAEDRWYIYERPRLLLQYLEKKYSFKLDR